MKLKDCNLNVDVVVTAPPSRIKPHDSWLSAYKNNFIPKTLYDFYVAADYFSFDKCPKFLQDNKKILFPHLEASIDLVKLSFEEYHELIDLLKKYDSLYPNPIKKIRGEKFELSAMQNFNRYFQFLIINMYSILDSTAEAIAILLSWGELGRGMFSGLVTNVKNSLGENRAASKTTIVDIDEKYTEDIKNVIRREIVEKKNNEWYELFKLYRNKLSHFRRYSGALLHDEKGNFYHFLPKQWPYYFKQDIMRGKKDDSVNIVFSDFLMGCDIFEYSEGLYKKIFYITEEIFGLLTETFKIKKDSGCNINPLVKKEVESLISKYKFENF